MLFRSELERQLFSMYKDIQSFHTNETSIVLCDCENGTPSFGGKCPGNGEFKCDNCNPGYSLESGVCRKNVCKCQFGKPNRGLKCPIDGKESCASCPFPFRFNELEKCEYHIQPEDWFTHYYSIDENICPSGTAIASFGNTPSEMLTWSDAEDYCNTIPGSIGR